jgi:hypothetical protein
MATLLPGDILVCWQQRCRAEVVSIKPDRVVLSVVTDEGIENYGERAPATTEALHRRNLIGWHAA